MKKCVVIGGGIAGISSAVHLINNNFHVKLYEASPKLGGRSYSFIDKFTNTEIDNGQHIMMGCYHNTLELIGILNSQDKIQIQNNLNITFLHPTKGKLNLSADKFFYPLNLLNAIFNYNALSVFEKVSVIKFISKLLFLNIDSLKHKTVKQWLDENGQTENSYNSLWNILIVGILNCSAEKASAEIFAKVLKEIFLTGSDSSKIIIPVSGLSKIFSEPALNFLVNKNSEIYLSQKLISIETTENKISKLFFENNIIEDFDDVIIAIPQNSFKKINFPDFLNYRYSISPILSIHLWLKERLFEENFIGLINSPLQWIFNNHNHISIVISDATAYIQMSHEQIVNIVECELKKYFPSFTFSQVLNSRVIKEKRATYITNSTLYKRPGIETKYDNLFLAGDWTDTGLPSTIESAVLSGKQAALNIVRKYH